jgi:DNA polymerase I-like protein with 3'-5' exonuclease and polymerase domains
MLKPEVKIHIIDTPELFDKFVDYVQQHVTSDLCIIDTETNNKQEKLAKLFGISLAFNDKRAFYIVWRDVNGRDLWSLSYQSRIAQWLVNICKNRKLIGHNLIYDLLVLEYNLNVNLEQYVGCDTLLLKHTLDELKPHGLKPTCQKLFGSWAIGPQEELYQSIKNNGGKVTKENTEIWKADTKILAEYSCWDCILTYLLYMHFLPQLKTEGLEDFFFKQEVMPLFFVTLNMKRQGFHIDVPHFQQLKQELTTELTKLEEELMLEINPQVSEYIQELLKEEFPLNHRGNFPKALAEIVKIPLPINTKTNKVSTSAKELDKLSKSYPQYYGFYEWIKGKTDLPLEYNKYILESRELLFKNKNPDKKYLFNLKSNQDLAHWIFDVLGYEPLEKTPTGDRKLDDDLLESIKSDNPTFNKLITYKKLGKLLQTYVKGILECKIENKIYASMHQTGTVSGRYSCISEGQLVSCPGGDKSIEQIKINDLVYCYKDDGTPTISKVNRVINNGRKNCLSITWKSQGTHKYGSLTCTPDHLVKLRNNTWIKAQDLKKEDSIYHLRRATKLVNGRCRIYAANYFMKNEEQLIKTEWFKGTSKQHIHHKNENKHDNKIANLELLNGADHCAAHSKKLWTMGRMKWQHLQLPKNKPTIVIGKDHPCWIPMSKFKVLKLLAKTHGHVTQINMDFNTFKRKAMLSEVNIEIVRRRYNVFGQYLSRGFLKRITKLPIKQKDKIKLSGVSYYKYLELVNKFGLENNHKVVSIKLVGPRNVYDLEVDHYHNFIVNELCVHNCSNVNLQNLPRKKDEDDIINPLVLKYTNAIRQGFIAPSGYVLIDGDYDQIEARCFTSISGEKNLQQVFYNGEDIYSKVSADIHKINLTGISLKKKDNNFFGKLYPKERFVGKTITLAIPYGSKTQRVSEILNCSRQEAKNIINTYLLNYPTLHKWMKASEYQAKHQGFIKTQLGRIRHLPALKIMYEMWGDQIRDYTWASRNNLLKERRQYEVALNSSKNIKCQGYAASIINQAMIAMHKEFKKQQLDAHIILTVHDEVLVISRKEHSQQVIEIIKDKAENTNKLEVPLIMNPKAARTWAEAK